MKLSSTKLRRKKASHDEWLIAYADLLTNLLVFFAVILAGSKMSQAKMQSVAQQISGQSSAEDLSEIQSKIEQKIAEKSSYSQVVKTELGEDGLRISIDAAMVFHSGSAEIPGQYQNAMRDLMKEISPFVEYYQFAVEGHADAQRMGSNGFYRSNWELSAARAQSLLNLLAQIGIPEQRLHVEGYGSSRSLPAEKLQGLSDAEKLARHRRVVIRIY